MVPRGSPCLGHVAPPNLPSTCHVSKIDLFTYFKSKLATSAYDHAMSTIWSCHVGCMATATSAVWTVQSTNVFLPVWKIKQIAISNSSDVHLSLFKVHWVSDNEAYAPVHFEAIPNTLIFGLNFDPWSRF
jgi:hypothetical protein